MNGSAIFDNSNLFDGDHVETMGVRCVLRVGDSELVLLPESRAQVSGDRTLLERGSSIATGGRTIFAGTLRIAPAANSALELDIAAAGRLSIAVREGAAEVQNASKLVIASMHRGQARTFEVDSNAAGGFRSQETSFHLTDRDWFGGRMPLGK